jgi:predicted DNA-binding transcriptional regulator AlpA
MSTSESRIEIRHAPAAEPLLTVADVAGWLNISPATLRYWRHVHRGPRSLSVGGAIRYRASDIEEWLDHGAKDGAR